MRTGPTSDLWWKNAIVYCLDVETYHDADGDGCGDMVGLIERLDHAARLGATLDAVQVAGAGFAEVGGEQGQRERDEDDQDRPASPHRFVVHAESVSKMVAFVIAWAAGCASCCCGSNGEWPRTPPANALSRPRRTSAVTRRDGRASASPRAAARRSPEGASRRRPA